MSAAAVTGDLDRAGFAENLHCPLAFGMHTFAGAFRVSLPF